MPAEGPSLSQALGSPEQAQGTAGGEAPVFPKSRSSISIGLVKKLKHVHVMLEFCKGVQQRVEREFPQMGAPKQIPIDYDSC